MSMWTHLDGFNHLNSQELDALLEAPVLITVLVGAADGDLDREERVWSDRLMKVRTYNNPKLLNEYYAVVSNGFLEKVDAALAGFPADAATRNQIISDKLAVLNSVFPKLEPPLGADMYKSYLGLALETAKASGGFLRMGAISAEEKPWISLSMITPVEGESQAENWDDDETDW